MTKTKKPIKDIDEMNLVELVNLKDDWILKKVDSKIIAIIDERIFAIMREDYDDKD